MFVENVKGSSKISEAPPYPYNSWLDYWGKNSGQIFIPKKCPACGRIVTRKELDGYHVQKLGNYTGKIYIIPLCGGYNHRKNFFLVDENLLVPAP